MKFNENQVTGTSWKTQTELCSKAEELCYLSSSDLNGRGAHDTGIWLVAVTSDAYVLSKYLSLCVKSTTTEEHQTSPYLNSSWSYP